MKQELTQVFKNDKFGNIRVILINNKEHFVATDVAKALGYVNPRDAITKHCRWVAKCDVPHPQSKDKTLEVNAIPEGDLYRLIANSQLPSAEEFERWVFDEVLPSIRQHGAYMTSEIRERLKENPDYIIKLVQKLEDKELEIKELEQVNELLARNYNDIRLMYQNCTNEVAEYVISNLTYKRSGKIRCNDLYNHYCIWCKDTPHYEPYDRKKFEELLLERMVQGHSIIKNGNYYMGIEKRV